MSFFGLPTTSQQGRALEKQTISRLPRTRRQTGGPGNRLQRWLWYLTLVWWCRLVSLKAFGEAHWCTACGKYTHAWPVTGVKIKTKTRGFTLPSFPHKPHLSYHMAFFLPTPAYGSVSVWKLPRSDNLSSAGECVVTNTVSPGWMTSQLHSARETGLLCS